MNDQLGLRFAMPMDATMTGTYTVTFLKPMPLVAGIDYEIRQDERGRWLLIAVVAEPIDRPVD
jgi:hypothetical protein